MAWELGVANVSNQSDHVPPWGDTLTTPCDVRILAASLHPVKIRSEKPSTAFPQHAREKRDSAGAIRAICLLNKPLHTRVTIYCRGERDEGDEGKFVQRTAN